LTGKSTIILSIKQMFDEKKVKYKIYSFTGSSAFLIGGLFLLDIILITEKLSCK